MSAPTPAERSERKVRVIANNKRAEFEYFVVQRIEAGIVLTGTEVKSLRAGKVNLQDAYAEFPDRKSTELYMLNMHISPYDFGNRENHPPLRKRKLLVSHREALKIRQAIQEKGLTLVPLSIYFSGPYVKVELGVCKGKKLYDKRATMKDKEQKRAIQRGGDE